MSGLAPGTRLGPYEIVAPIGAGGMGEVYKARDTRLDRTVAVKVILTATAASPEFRDRFDREARAISALDHPHICTLYDVGHEGDVAYLVMQFIEGENLADRLARAGRPASDPTVVASRPPSGDASIAASVTSLSASRGPLTIDLALRYAAEIAAALDAAHRRGIVHRDLKPGNVMLTKSGTKLLDFGLAKLATSPITGFDEGATRLSPFGAVQGGAITGQGTILGTLHYMSPEQIEGRDADARSDIFSFGALLFEMLSGRRAFDPGATSSGPASPASVLAAIVGGDAPELGELADTKARLPIVARRALDRLLQKCLAKQLDDRWQSAADLSDELRWINEERLRAAEPDPTAASPSVPTPNPVPRTRERIWMTATGMAVVAAIAVAAWLWPQPAKMPAAIQFTLEAPEGAPFTSGPGFISVSPDGQYIAFTSGEQTSGTQLYLRSAGTLDVRPVPAAINAWHVAWSPDGKSIVYTPTGGQSGLLRVDLAGGPARTLSDDAFSERAAWSREGVILFTPGAAPQRLMRVPAAGGPATPATELNATDGETNHAWPVFLPDGRRFIFLARNRDPSKSALFLASLDSMERTRLVDVRSMVDLVPGYLVYHRDGTLYAHPFDEDSGTLTGDPVPVVEDVEVNTGNGRAAFATSRTGLLVFRSGAASRDGTLSWVDRSGKVVGTFGQPGQYAAGAISPDGRRYVVPVGFFGVRDLVMLDIERNITSRFTADPANNQAPLWTPDGESVVFSSDRKGVADLHIKNAGGASPEQVLFESTESKYATGYSPDGKLLLFTAGSRGERRVWALPIGGDGKPSRVFPNETGEHTAATFSPDGKWITYQAGSPPNVFVKPFPPTGYREQISATQGASPKWTADGRQIAFQGPDNSLMIADVTPEGSRLRVSAPRQLFQKLQTAGVFGFAMDARAERFLLVVPPAAPSEVSAAPLTVIVNWPSLVAKK